LTNKSTVSVQNSSQRRLFSDNESDLEDQVSIMALGQISPRDYDSEKLDCELENSASALSQREEHLSDMQKKCLVDMFGDDALVKKNEKKMVWC
jgi:hypothetical protein